MDLIPIITAARGDSEVDLLLTHAKIINVFSGRIIDGSIAIKDGHIVGVRRLRRHPDDKPERTLCGPRIHRFARPHRKFHDRHLRIRADRGPLWYHHRGGRSPRNRQRAGDGGHRLHAPIGRGPTHGLPFRAALLCAGH
jgi:hypothetical protein